MLSGLEGGVRNGVGDRWAAREKRPKGERGFKEKVITSCWKRKRGASKEIGISHDRRVETQGLQKEKAITGGDDVLKIEARV